MRIILSILICFLLYGCATPGLSYGPRVAISQEYLGKTKEEVLWLFGSPGLWSRNVTDGNIKETWSYNNFSWVFDFENGKVVGCSYAGRYFTKDGVDDVRTYRDPFKKKQ